MVSATGWSELRVRACERETSGGELGTVRKPSRDSIRKLPKESPPKGVIQKLSLGRDHRKTCLLASTHLKLIPLRNFRSVGDSYMERWVLDVWLLL